MGSVLDNLIINLDEQIKTLEQCEKLLAGQQEYLVRNDVDSLKINMTNQSRLISKARNLERKRLAIVNDYLREAGSGREDIKLGDLCNEVDPEYGNQLRELRQTLKVSLDRVNLVRRQNESLIKQSLEMINGTMKIYYHEDNRGVPSYTAGGNTPNDQGVANMVLNKIV
ncbi:MAG: hypothetical protein CO189_09625 [candidate division Zixibacteria bacterium CG_4_9_14_3_um_filter_46_8]|nr:MAG: hypothetical protein CO189_09625 [candidate division Zixibacteria bacterium CG_4_9_14_3_um_filter_46_8]